MSIDFPIILNFIENQHMQGHEFTWHLPDKQALRNPFSQVFLSNPEQIVKQSYNI